jgi:hypothetical protein
MPTADTPGSPPTAVANQPSPAAQASVTGTFEPRFINVQFYEMKANGVEPTVLMDSIAAIPSQPTSARVVKVGDYQRDIWEVQKAPHYLCGTFRRWRMGDSPLVGKPGEQAAPLILEPGNGTADVNYFIYWPAQRLLGWHNNSLASGVGNFTAALTKMLQVSVQAEPVMTAASTEKLMSPSANLVKVHISIAKPKNPDLYPSHTWSQSIFRMLGNSDRLNLVLSINRRKKDRGTVPEMVKEGMVELAGEQFDPKVARVFVEDESRVYPVDLIAERIRSRQEVKPNENVFDAFSYYRAIREARDEQQGAINAVLGVPGNALS